MIKNILYSLFLHSLLGLMIYANFRSTLSEDIIDLTEGVKISMIDAKSLDAAKNQKGVEAIKKPQEPEEKKAEEPIITEKKEEPKPEVKEEKKPEIKEKKEEKPVEKKQVEKKEVKKITKKAKEKTKNKAALKPIESPKKEFKKIEEPKKEVAKNIKEEKVTEEAQDEVKEEVKEDKNKKDEEEKEEIKENVESAPAEVLPPDLETINLSAREKFNIHAQLSACYMRAKEGRKDLKIDVIVKVFVLQDGTIDYDQNVIDIERYNNAKEVEYRTMIDNVKKTMELCSPLRNLPLDKYDVWKEFTIKFGDTKSDEPATAKPKNSN